MNDPTEGLIAQILHNLVRVGLVSSVDPDAQTVRVVFDDKEETVSYDLPIVVPFTFKNKVQRLPDIDDQVLCIFLPNGEEEGFILGGFYSTADKPLSSEKEEYIYAIPGGFVISVNRKAHEVVMMDSYGSKVVFRDGDIIFQSAHHIHLNPGDVHVPEHLNYVLA